VEQQVNLRIIFHLKAFAGKRAFGDRPGVKYGLAMFLFQADYSES